MKKNNCKMIVMDLDGTLLDKSRKISLNTKKYLTLLKSKGYIIVIATGRIYASALRATDEAEFSNYVITDTGACIYDMKNFNPIFEKTIPKDMARKILDYYNDDFCFIDVCDKDVIYKYADENNEFVKSIRDKEYIFESCKKIFHITITMKTNDAVILLYKQLIREFPDLEVIIMQDSFAEKIWIDIMTKSCSKYNAIKTLTEYLNINIRDVIAFGDGLNDIEMLEKCGKGVALQNALDEVKKVADDITIYDHDNEGVMHYLKNYLK